MDNFLSNCNNDENVTKTEAVSVVKSIKTDLIAKNTEEDRLKSVENSELNEIITGYTHIPCG